MVTRKDRRHSGYVTPNATISFEDIKKFDLFINPFYDDWEDYRDSMRNKYGDSKKIKKVCPKRGKYSWNSLFEKRVRMNAKQKRLLRVREAKKINQAIQRASF